MFVQLLNVSITASWLVLVILVLRLLLRKVPRWIFCLLWAMVAVRLVCPVFLESPYSMVPNPQTISEEYLYMEPPEYQADTVWDIAENPMLPDAAPISLDASAERVQIWDMLAAPVWAAGCAAMLLYALFSTLLLRRRLAAATLLRDNIKQSERIASPFVMGLFRPVIYIPYGIEGADLDYVIAHERAHLRHGDHWWKWIGFLLLSVYWFNPLLWLAYGLFCRDLESACDARVVGRMDREERRGYATALLRCSVRRRSAAACLLGFGEMGVKRRIKAVMEDSANARGIAAAAMMVCVLVAFCFLTDPLPGRTFPMAGDAVTDLSPDYVISQIARIEKLEDDTALYIIDDQFQVNLTPDFRWVGDPALRFFYNRGEKTRGAQLRMFCKEQEYSVTKSSTWHLAGQRFPLEQYLEALRYLPQAEIRQLSPEADHYMILMAADDTPEGGARTITYTARGVGAVQGPYIHLAVFPMHGANGAYRGTGDEVIDLFYGA